MRQNKIWARLLGIEHVPIDSVELEEDEQGPLVVARVHKHPEDRGRCSQCRRLCPGYDQGVGERRWRTLDLGTIRAFVEAAAPRVTCPEHGIVVENTPWAHGTGRFTRCFEETVAWLAARTDKTAVSTLARIAWRTVGGIIERVVDVQKRMNKGNQLDGVTRIGVDEVSYRRGHRYLTVVVDHDSGRLLFAHKGKDAAAIEAFFDDIGAAAENIKLVSLDASPTFNEVCQRRCPQAELCMDPFHVVKWANDAVDKVRRQAWNAVRATGDQKAAVVIKDMRYAVLKNPEDLNDKQRLALSLVEKHNKPLFRAYLLKEQLREVFKTRDTTMLTGWLAWAQRSRIPEFVEVGRSIKRIRPAIDSALNHGLSNARVEGLNTRMQLLTRVAFGFHSAKALIALAMLKLGGLCPSLPGRATHGSVS
jgi:transposase